MFTSLHTRQNFTTRESRQIHLEDFRTGPDPRQAQWGQAEMKGRAQGMNSINDMLHPQYSPHAMQAQSMANTAENMWALQNMMTNGNLFQNPTMYDYRMGQMAGDRINHFQTSPVWQQGFIFGPDQASIMSFPVNPDTYAARMNPNQGPRMPIGTRAQMLWQQRQNAGPNQQGSFQVASNTRPPGFGRNPDPSRVMIDVAPTFVSGPPGPRTREFRERQENPNYVPTYDPYQLAQMYDAGVTPDNGDNNPGQNPDTLASDTLRVFRNVYFWEGGRPNLMEQAGVPADQRKFLMEIRAEALTNPDATRRVGQLYLVHLCEDFFLMMAQNPERSDQNIQTMLRQFNHLTREFIALDPEGARQLRAAGPHITIPGGGTMRWDNTRGWEIRVADGTVVREERGAGGSAGGRSSRGGETGRTSSTSSGRSEAGGRRTEDRTRTGGESTAKSNTQEELKNTRTQLSNVQQRLKQNESTLEKANAELENLRASRKKLTADRESAVADEKALTDQMRQVNEKHTADQQKLSAQRKEYTDKVLAGGLTKGGVEALRKSLQLTEKLIDEEQKNFTQNLDALQKRQDAAAEQSKTTNSQLEQMELSYQRQNQAIEKLAADSAKIRKEISQMSTRIEQLDKNR